MNIDFKNVNHRKDYLSVDKLTAISAEGELFEVGDLVETDDPKLGTSIITHFTLDEESCDVKGHTEKGWNRICFLSVVRDKVNK
jgi:hypothetical protein